MASAIPRIDLTPLRADGLTGASSQPVLDAIREAGAGLGFLCVTGHGVPPELRKEMDLGARAFFALPAEAKQAVSPRRWNEASPNVYRGYFPSSTAGKEGFDIGDPRLAEGDPVAEALLERPYCEVNRLPSLLGAQWRTTVEHYYDALHSLGELLVQAMVKSLGGDPTPVSASFERPGSLSTLRFNHYPKTCDPVEVSAEDGVALACETHVDSGLLTILYQDAQGGLQVRDSQRAWQDIPFDADVFVVNTGLAFERITRGAFVATRHRVLHAPAERLSIPFFFEPVHEFEISPYSFGLGDRDAEAPDSYGDFLQKSLEKFAEYDRPE